MENVHYTLFGLPGYGSAIVEAALELTGLPYRVEDLDHSELGPGSARLSSINPLGQVPTLAFPDGTAMAQSAAIILHLNDVAPQARLAPGPEDPTRPQFLHWLMFLTAGLYPTFTFGDEPARWVDGAEPGQQLRDRTDRQRQDLWRFVESSVDPGPWFLGTRFSALDLYMAVMVGWRPGRDWFSDHCPKLTSVARAGLAIPELRKVWQRNKIEV
ncbi:MAG: glutathione S-transferase family protein [Pseudomonadota bacterium]